MTYPKNFEQKTGFDQIRSLIKEKCLSALGIDYTDRMEFSTDYEVIRKQLNQTWEFVHIIENADDFPANFFFDVRPSLKRIRIEGTFLEETELFDLRRSLDTIQGILRFLRPDSEEDEIKYPFLYELSKEVGSFPQLIKQIDAILDKVKGMYAGESITDIDGVKIDFEDKWVHLRKSNTEPIIRVYSEAHTMDEADRLGKEIMQVVYDMQK